MFLIKKQLSHHSMQFPTDSGWNDLLIVWKSQMIRYYRCVPKHFFFKTSLKHVFFSPVFPAHLIFEIFYCFGFKLDLSKIAQREFNHTLKLISTCFRKKKYRYHTISMTISMMREKKILNYLELAHKIPLDMFPCISDYKKKKE